MNIEYYRNFVKVVEAGTISAASRELLIAQPALSNQMKTLEKIYGTPLLIRQTRCLVLTDAGKILYSKAKSMLSLEDIAQKEIAACIQGNRGTLWLGLPAALPSPYISKLLLDFSKAYPEISFEIFEGSTDVVAEWLKAGIIEIAIMRTRKEAFPLLKSKLTIEEPLMAVYRRANPWFPENRKSISVSELKGIPLSISKGLRQIVADACSEEGFSPEFKCVSTSRIISLLFSQNGEAITILPVGNVADYENAEFCCRPIDCESLRLSKSFHYLKDHNFSNVAKLFMDFSEKRYHRE